MSSVSSLAQQLRFYLVAPALSTARSESQRDLARLQKAHLRTEF